MSRPKKQPDSQQTITAHIFLAISDDGGWIARGSGHGDEWMRRDDAVPPGMALERLGDDDRAVEIVEVVVEVPVPVPKILEGRLF